MAKTHSTRTDSSTLLTRTAVALPYLLCFGAALTLIGCGGTGSSLDDAARGISKRSSKLHDEGEAGAGAEDMSEEDGLANLPVPDSKQKTEPVYADGPVVMGDDSVRCGDGHLDDNELCDIAIPEGEEGACPKASDCEPLDECHKAAFEARTCWSQCVLGEPIEC